MGNYIADYVGKVFETTNEPISPQNAGKGQSLSPALYIRKHTLACILLPTPPYPENQQFYSQKYPLETTC